MKIGDLLGRTDLTEKFVLQKFLCTFLDCSREQLWLNTNNELPDGIIKKVLAAYKSYIEDKKPLEYILGHVDFFGNEFTVTEDTLIPRPETEFMVTAVTEFIRNQGLLIQSEKNVLLDIGTGCGVLGISVLLQNLTYFSEVTFTDYYEKALDVAKTNYERLVTDYGGKVSFIRSDLLDFVDDYEELEDWENGNVILVANLPYIPEDVFENNVSDNVKKREPKPAFVGGDDGLDYYKKMFDQILNLSFRGSKLKLEKISMFLEMMTWQVDVLRTLYGDTFTFEEVKTFHFNIRIIKVYLT